MLHAKEELAEATAALRLSQSGEGSEAAVVAAPAPEAAAESAESMPATRMRNSSFGVMHNLAKSRIATFHQASCARPARVRARLARPVSSDVVLALADCPVSPAAAYE